MWVNLRILCQKYISQEQKYWAVFRYERGQLEVTVGLIPLYAQTGLIYPDRWGFYQNFG